MNYTLVQLTGNTWSVRLADGQYVGRYDMRDPLMGVPEPFAYCYPTEEQAHAVGRYMTPERNTQ